MSRAIAALGLFAVLSVGGCESGPSQRTTEVHAVTPTGMLSKTFTHEGVTYPYLVYVPRGYAADRDWPTIMFLHGRGECGTDGFKQAMQGLGAAVMWDPQAWPFVIILPQKPDPNKQWEDYDAVVMGMLDATRREYRTDVSRTYLTGLSQGGHGAWTLGSMHPDTWAAVVPICGYVARDWNDKQAEQRAAREMAEKLKNTPIWAFHGEADNVVPPSHQRAMMTAFEAVGGTAERRATYYPGVGHNSWDRAYREEKDAGGVAAWLLKHSLPK
ncbi:MAG: prolyl oligopeptidase family serine peptidase [Tepidisphaera sp.]